MFSYWLRWPFLKWLHGSKLSFKRQSPCTEAQVTLIQMPEMHLNKSHMKDLPQVRSLVPRGQSPLTYLSLSSDCDVPGFFEGCPNRTKEPVLKIEIHQFPSSFYPQRHVHMQTVHNSFIHNSPKLKTTQYLIIVAWLNCTICFQWNTTH